VSVLEKYIRWVVRHRLAVVVAVLAVTALLGTQLRHLHLEIRRRANLPDRHPYVQIQNRISDLFGGEAVAIVGIVASSGDIYRPAILGKVHRITHGFLNTPGVISTSLFSMAAPFVKTVTTGADDMMEVRPLMETPPDTPAAISDLRRVVEADRLLNGNLVSADGSATVIVAEFDDRLTDVDIARRIEEIVAPERDDSVRIALAGAPILRAWLARYTAMIGILLPLAVLVIGLVHYEAFRTLQGMFLPLLTAVLSVVWALGIMGLTGYPMDTWSAITPVVILAVAAGHAVQILKRYYEEFAIVHDSHEAVVRSITAVGPVMLTAGCIAAAGFASLVTFGITSVRVFGLLLASGILSALVIEMSFTPACRCLLPPPKRRETSREGQSRWLDRGLDGLAGVVLRRPREVLWAALLVLVVAAIGILRLEVDNSFRLWFAASTQVRQDDALLNQKLPGTASLRLLIDGAHENALQEPAVLKVVSDLEDFLAKDPAIGGVSSIAGHVKRMHQAMHAGNPEFYAIPDSQPLISQYLLLYSMSAGPDSLSAVVDASFQHGIVRALSKNDGAAFSRSLIDRVQAFVDGRFHGLPVTIGVAGGTLGVQTAMNDVVVHDKIVNLVQVSLIIFVLAAVVLRSLLGGLFVLLPLTLAVVVNLGLMGWTNIWLDMTTAAITAMGVGIGADFAIYLIFRIREELLHSGDFATAVRTSLRTSGKAIFFVSSAVALGYMVLPFSGFSLWIRLGLLTATIVGVSAFGAVTILPALVLVTKPRFIGVAADAAATAQRASAQAAPDQIADVWRSSR
jgi:hypothetical protein